MVYLMERLTSQSVSLNGGYYPGKSGQYPPKTTQLSEIKAVRLQVIDRLNICRDDIAAPTLLGAKPQPPAELALNKDSISPL